MQEYLNYAWLNVSVNFPLNLFKLAFLKNEWVTGFPLFRIYENFYLHFILAHPLTSLVLNSINYSVRVKEP